MHFSQWFGHHEWQINEHDMTISPLNGSDLVVGWTKHLCMVEKDSPQRLRLKGFYLKYDYKEDVYINNDN